MKADALTTVSIDQDLIEVINVAGKRVVNAPAISMSITYEPGREDDAIATASAGYSALVDRINEARPAASPTQKEGPTTP